jgi:periplasmic protein TonB
VNSHWRRLLAAADAPKLRLALACAIAAGVWAVFLAHVVRLFVQDERPPAAPETIEMKLVEIAPPEPERRAIAPTLPAVAPSRNQKHVDAAKPLHSTTQAPVRHETAAPAMTENTRPAIASRPPQDEPVAAPAREKPTTAPAATENTASRDGADAAPASSPAGSTRARLLSQPLPVLPDDLREDAYRAEAIARFDVHADGSIDVELIKPTSNPRLNQILLETLHRWRFFPAMENGRPVDSRQDVRVHFNVS